MIPFENDTLVGITKHQFDVVLFGFSYIQELEETSEITSKQLSRKDSIIRLMSNELSLERLKLAERDTIQMNLEEAIRLHKKELRRKAVKNTFLNIGLGIGLVAETALLIHFIQ